MKPEYIHICLECSAEIVSEDTEEHYCHECNGCLVPTNEVLVFSAR